MEGVCLMTTRTQRLRAQTTSFLPVPGQELRLKGVCSSFALMTNKVNVGTALPGPGRSYAAQCKGWGCVCRNPDPLPPGPPVPPVGPHRKGLQALTCPSSITFQHWDRPSAQLQPIMHVGGREWLFPRCSQPKRRHL